MNKGIKISSMVCVILIIPMLLTSCYSKWVAYPQYVKKYEKCNPFNSEPQMLSVPGFENTSTIVKGGSCHIVDQERVSIAISIYLESWKESFGDSGIFIKDVEKAFNNLLIEFNSEIKMRSGVYFSDGKRANKPVHLNGLMISPKIMWVKTMPGERLCHTSFAHELTHAAIWAIKKTDGDPDHLGNKWYGWTDKHQLVIQDTNKKLCRLGI